MLSKLNTHGVAFAGLAIGGGSIVASVAAFFRLLSNADYFDALIRAVLHARNHALDNADYYTFAQIAAAVVAIVGAIVVALLLSYFGMPRTVDASANANDAAQASTVRKE